MVLPKYTPEKFDIIAYPGGHLSWCLRVNKDKNECTLVWFGRRYGAFKIDEFPLVGENRRFYRNVQDPEEAIKIIKNDKAWPITVEDIKRG